MRRWLFAKFHDRFTRIVDARGERLPGEDASFDCVVATLVPCSVRDPQQTAREIRRVLRPGGRYRSQDTPLATTNRAVLALVRRRLPADQGDRCPPRTGGLRGQPHVEEPMPAAPFWVRPTIRGVARIG